MHFPVWRNPRQEGIWDKSAWNLHNLYKIPVMMVMIYDVIVVVMFLAINVKILWNYPQFTASHSCRCICGQSNTVSGVPSGRRPGRVQDKIPKIARQKITLRGVQPVNETAHAIKGGRELDRNVLQGKFSQIFDWQNCLMQKDVRIKKVFGKNRCGSDRSSLRHEAFFF